jgi:drug/metabolite transporter (DMT)-like permease
MFIIGMATALAGACVLMGRSFTLSPINLLGDALGLVTAAFYAGYIVSVGRLRAKFSTATIMAWSGLVTCLTLFPVALGSGEDLVPMTLSGWAVLIGLALLSHAGGQSLIAYALAHLSAAFSSVSLLLQPAVAAVLAWVILGEALGSCQGLGALMILVGIYFAHRGSRAAALTGKASAAWKPRRAARRQIISAREVQDEPQQAHIGDRAWLCRPSGGGGFRPQRGFRRRL